MFSVYMLGGEERSKLSVSHKESESEASVASETAGVVVTSLRVAPVRGP